MLYVDGFFVGRGWGSSIGTTSGYEGKLSNKYGFARFDGSLEYRVPIQEQFIWLAAFVDIVNLIEGPKRRFVYTDSNGNAITSGDSVIYSTSSDDAWRWWDQTENNKWYNKDMSNWYGMENWYGSIGLGVQLAIPQLPLSFYIVKRFQINYQGGFEWCGNVANSPNLDFVLSMTGIYF
jgi:outer membrane protein assembly factor BamA